MVGEPDGGPLTDRARYGAPGGAVVVAGEPDAAGVPLLAGRGTVGGTPAAYVCRGYVCEVPVTGPDDLGELLAR